MEYKYCTVLVGILRDGYNGGRAQMMRVTGRNHRVHVRVFERMRRRMEALEGRETINEKDIGKWLVAAGGRRAHQSVRIRFVAG